MKKKYYNPPFTAKVFLLVSLLVIGYAANKKDSSNKNQDMNDKSFVLANLIQ